ncbi:hypothetical protein BDV36DRAFT_137806 [Aspergillus pseudocaelatus]|uniref:Uncharacterized protein n=1 Tax=Aspergillus pseudocaelatus TaxID=1825620 RepID=A0ABQ6WS71_9EURO|nr:hypothetical protein BDV36DRAFT_137806 [Aspergillus pseudocaelatus]
MDSKSHTTFCISWSHEGDVTLQSAPTAAYSYRNLDHILSGDNANNERVHCSTAKSETASKRCDGLSRESRDEETAEFYDVYDVYVGRQLKNRDCYRGSSRSLSHIFSETFGAVCNAASMCTIIIEISHASLANNGRGFGQCRQPMADLGICEAHGREALNGITIRTATSDGYETHH